MQTRKYPRTMKEAFGPYTDNNLQPQEKDRPMDWQDKLVLKAGILCLIALVAVVTL